MYLSITSRQVFLGISIVCASMMGVGYALQFGLGLEPCPLCITQRIFITATGLVALTAALHGPRVLGIRIYSVIAILFALIGGGFSARHLWLQSLPPDQAPACGPDLTYILDTFPVLEALEILLRGNGNCAVVDWTFLGVSIPGWTLVAFGLLATAAGFVFWKPVRT